MRIKPLCLTALAITLLLAGCASSPPATDTAVTPPDGTTKEPAAPEQPATGVTLQDGEIPTTVGDYTLLTTDTAAAWGYDCTVKPVWTLIGNDDGEEYRFYYLNEEGIENLRPFVEEKITDSSQSCLSVDPLRQVKQQPGIIKVGFLRENKPARDMSCGIGSAAIGAILSCSTDLPGGWRTNTFVPIVTDQDAELAALGVWFQEFLDSSPLVERVSVGGGALD